MDTLGMWCKIGFEKSQKTGERVTKERNTERATRERMRKWCLKPQNLPYKSVWGPHYSFLISRSLPSFFNLKFTSLSYTTHSNETLTHKESENSGKIRGKKIDYSADVTRM